MYVRVYVQTMHRYICRNDCAYIKGPDMREEQISSIIGFTSLVAAWSGLHFKAIRKVTRLLCLLCLLRARCRQFRWTLRFIDCIDCRLPVYFDRQECVDEEQMKSRVDDLKLD